MQLDTPFKSVARATRQGSAAVMPRWLLLSLLDSDDSDERVLPRLELIGDEGAAKGGNPKGHPRRLYEAPFEGHLRLKTAPFSSAVACPRTAGSRSTVPYLSKAPRFSVLSPRPPGQRPDTGRPRRMGLVASAKWAVGHFKFRWSTVGFSCAANRTHPPDIGL